MITIIKGLNELKRTLLSCSCKSKLTGGNFSLVFRSNLMHNKLGMFRSVHLNAPQKGKQKIGASGILLLAIPAATFCLGTWQVKRRRWKLDLIEELEKKTRAPPINLPEEFEELENLEYQRVILQGNFDHSREIYLGPRPLMSGGDVHQHGSGLISSGQSGYLVITPFKVLDRDSTILVNRGWVSRNKKNASTRPLGQVEGPVEFTALVRKTEQCSPFMPESQKGSLVFTYRNVPAMAHATASAPIFVDAIETFDGGPIGAQTRVTLRNEHASYILTWYTLSLATSYLWYKKFIQGRPLM